LRPDPTDHASISQCAYRFNTYIGLSLASGVAGSAGQTVMAILVGIAVPISNIAAVYALARQNGGKVLREIIRNPFIIATVLGLLCNFLRIPIPEVIDVTLSRLGACAIAIGLMCVGTTLSLQGTQHASALVGWVTASRLVAMPLLALLIGWLLDLSLIERQTLLLFGA